MDKLKLDIDNLGELIKQTFALRRETLEAISVLCRNDHPTFPTGANRGDGKGGSVARTIARDKQDDGSAKL